MIISWLSFFRFVINKASNRRYVFVIVMCLGDYLGIMGIKTGDISRQRVKIKTPQSRL